jgi:hypothetical protein
MWFRKKIYVGTRKRQPWLRSKKEWSYDDDVRALGQEEKTESGTS